MAKNKGRRISPGVYAPAPKSKPKGASVRPPAPVNNVDPAQQQNQDISNFLGPDGAGAAALAGKTFGEGSLGRVSEGRSDEVNQGLAQSIALRNFYGPGGQGRSSETADVMARMKGGLGGYTGPEQAANRQAAEAGLNTQYQTQARALQEAQGGTTRGQQSAAQLSRLGASRIKAQSDTEQGLFQKNADEQQRRLAAYGQFQQGVENTEFGRTMDTNQLAFGQTAAARQDELARQQYNQAQGASEKSGYLGTLFGGMNYKLAQKNQQQQYQLGKQGIAASKSRGGGGGPDYASYFAGLQQANANYGNK